MKSDSANKVSVVIPAYRAEKTIRRAIDSVLQQEEVETKVIVVVNGDTDNTAQIVRGYADPRVSVFVNAENKGVTFSRNRGLGLVEDEFVMFLDADDFLEGPLLRGLASELSRIGGDLGLGPMQTFLEAKGTRGPTTVLQTEPVEDLFTGWLSEGRFVVPCCILWRTSFARKIGGFDLDLRLQDDGELVMRAILLGAKVVRSDLGRGVYVIHNSPNRQTQRTDTLDSLLKIPAKLMGIQSSVVTHDLVKRACSACYYNAARTCFIRGRDDLGHEALQRSRQLGFQGHRGSTAEKIVSSAIGLRLRCKVEYAARHALGKPGG